MDNLANNSPKKRKVGRPRKIKSVQLIANLTATPQGDDVNEIGNSTCRKEREQTRRSGRQVNVPSRYKNYCYDEKDIVNEIEPNDIYECDACIKTFSTKGSVCSHQYYCTAEKSIVCDICNLTLASYKDLRQHQKKHRTHSCDFCKQQFSNLAEYRVHCRWHSLQTLECKICHKRFLRVKGLKDHMVQEHDQPMEIYSCAMCKKTFALLDYLKEHQKMHEGEDGFTMDYMVKPLVKDTTKRYTCAHAKPGKSKKYFIKKRIKPVEQIVETKKKKADDVIVKPPVDSVNDLVKRTKKEIEASKHVFVHVHVQHDEEEGEKISTTCTQTEVPSDQQSLLEQEQQKEDQLMRDQLIQQETAESVLSLMGGQLPEGCVVVLTESGEAHEGLVGTSASSVVASLLQQQVEAFVIKDCGKEVLSNIDSEHTTSSLVHSEKGSETNEHQHQEGKSIGDHQKPLDQVPLQNACEKHQIILQDGTIAMEHDDGSLVEHDHGNLMEGQQMILQELETIPECNGQPMIVQDDSFIPGQIHSHPIIIHEEQNIVDGQQHHTVILQEGPNGEEQHVILQSSKHILMQSEDGTTLLLEGDCSVGDSIIVTAMQHTVL